MIQNQDLPLGMVTGMMMHGMFKLLKKRFEKQAEIKLSIDQFGLLHAIKRENNDVIQKNMAERMGKDKSTILRLIDSLEEKELVRRAVDTNDRRKNYLLVTKKGEKVIKEYQKIEFELLDELQQGLSTSEINTFYKVVNTIISNTEKLQYLSIK